MLILKPDTADPDYFPLFGGRLRAGAHGANTNYSRKITRTLKGASDHVGVPAKFLWLIVCFFVILQLHHQSRRQYAEGRFSTVECINSSRADLLNSVQWTHAYV